MTQSLQRCCRMKFKMTQIKTCTITSLDSVTYLVTSLTSGTPLSHTTRRPGWCVVICAPLSTVTTAALCCLTTRREAVCYHPIQALWETWIRAVTGCLGGSSTGGRGMLVRTASHSETLCFITCLPLCVWMDMSIQLF